MNKDQYKLIIAHRVCDKICDSPAIFTDKFKMIQANMWSLVRAIGDISAFIYIILDNCPKKYYDFYNKFLASNLNENCDYKLITTEGIGNKETFGKQLDVLSETPLNCEYVYFSEDDYYYETGALVKLINFMDKNKDADFATPLDHPDRYTHIVAESKKTEIRMCEDIHWRQVGTTCCTFLTRKNILSKAYKQINMYRLGSGDGPLWQGITKDALFSFEHTVKRAFKHVTTEPRIRYGKDANWGKYMALESWLWHKWRIFFYKKWTLWSPMPTLALHMCVPSISPAAEDLISEAEKFNDFILL